MKLLRKKWVQLLLGLVALILLIVGLGAYLVYPGMKMPPAPDFTPPANQAEANRQDIAYLRDVIHEMDRSFSKEEWRDFDRILDQLDQRAGQLDQAALEMGFAEAMAKANNGHTNLLGAGWGLTLNSLPLRFYWFADGLYVVKSDPTHRDLLGAQVMEVAGRTPAELVKTFSPYTGGRETIKREFAVHFMESPQALHAVGVLASPDMVPLKLRKSDGHVVEQAVSAVAGPVNGPPPPKSALTLMFDPREIYWPRRELSSVPLPQEAPFPKPVNDDRPWVHVLDGKKAAFTLRNPNSFYWATDLSDNIIYVQMNATMDDPQQEPMGVFLDRIIKRIDAKKHRYAIIDFRSNPGGNFSLPAKFTEELPKHIPANGKIFVLTSANTYSAGVVTTARLKYFAKGRAEIVGEPAGDYLQFWAEAASRIVLPNSGRRVAYATGYHDWKNGCSFMQLFTCHLGSILEGVPAGDIDPTIPVSWSFADYLEGRDSLVQRVLQTIAESEGK